ncbi:MarR family transcriptional regulator (plasmid) [Staphylococcus haemolyticus]|uniref:MarR family winged helix-turn-helix transcriptional regulator n=2 Tax=Staphylococcus haemolyticus TaxID=1283 RepID=UPI0015D7D81F|nr:MarR family transcriptional regulator [Staphylococcus haemolyticus]WQL37082.1 MarR family transcriptional regulator [Staphylococcus haemolyticus]
MSDFNLKDLPDDSTLLKYEEQFESADLTSIELCLQLLTTAKKVTESYNHFFFKHGLSLSKFNLLMLLYRDPDKDISPSELATKAGISRGTVTGLLDSLEKSDYIKRIYNSDDRRKVTISLTNKGTNDLVNLLPTHYQKTTNLFSNVKKKDKNNLKTMLNEIYDNTSIFYEEEN